MHYTSSILSNYDELPAASFISLQIAFAKKHEPNC